MKKILLLTALILFSGIVKANDESSPEYDIKGFYLNLSGIGSYVSFDDYDETDSGYGGRVKLGLNLGQNIGVFVSADASFIDDDDEDIDEITLVHVDIGARLTLGDIESRFRPYGTVSYVGVHMADDFYEMTGSGFGVGGGVLLFLNQSTALDIGYTHSWLNLDELTVSGQTRDSDIDLVTQRIFVGLTFHF